MLAINLQIVAIAATRVRDLHVLKAAAAWKHVPLVSMAQAIRVVLLAIATSATFFGRLASKPSSQAAGTAPDRCQRIAARSP
jgi:hypothetical protein